jgi:hypothetical protein
VGKTKRAQQFLDAFERPGLLQQLVNRPMGRVLRLRVFDADAAGQCGRVGAERRRHDKAKNAGKRGNA